MNTQYEAIAEQFNNIESLDMVDDLIEALQERKEKIIKEGIKENEKKANMIKCEIDGILRHAYGEIIETAKKFNEFIDEDEHYITNDSVPYFGIKYSDLLYSILINMKYKHCNNFEEYYNLIRSKDEGRNPDYLTISLNTNLSDPEDVYFIDTNDNLLILRDVDIDVYIPY